MMMMMMITVIMTIAAYFEAERRASLSPSAVVKHRRPNSYKASRMEIRIEYSQRKSESEWK